VQIIAEYGGDPQGATGSGFVMDRQGHVITNNHVVAQAVSDDGPIEVIDHHGRRLRATVVGRSAVYDVAVLVGLGARNLRPAAFGSADQMRVGETVVAIGSPLGLSATVTSGLVSAVHRPVTTDQILRTGKAKYPVIGANIRGTKKLDGARVVSLQAGAPASRTDLKVGDLIIKVDGKPVTGSSDVVVAVRTHQPGEKVTLTVRRGGKTLEITVGLEGKTG
jgi:S1-C subfamily serine protease